MPVNSVPGYGWNKYYKLNEIYGWLDDMISKYPNLLTNFNYGKSYERRPLRAVKVSHKKVCIYSSFISDLLYSAILIEFCKLFTGKSHYFHWINHSFRWMDSGRVSDIFYQWIDHFKQNRDSLSSRKLWLGHCANNKCRWIRVHAHHSKLKKVN